MEIRGFTVKYSKIQAKQRKSREAKLENLGRLAFLLRQVLVIKQPPRLLW